MTTFTQLPGTLNLDIVQGDSLSVSIDFDRSLVGYTVDASVLSTPARAVIVPLTTTLVSAGDGIVGVSLTAQQTAGLPVGTYLWELTWLSDGNEKRKVMAGYLEVRHR